MSDPLDDLRLLRELPARDAGEDVAKRTRRQAAAAFEREAAGRGGIAYYWSRWLMPAMLAGAVGVYLTWAFQLTSALNR